MLHVIADNWSKQQGWTWQGALLGIGILVVVGVILTAVFRKR